jgi:hypothetical protein
VTSAVHSLDLAAAGAVIVHRLPHAAGMGQGRGNGHGHPDKRAREQQHKQRSGGHAKHDWFGWSRLGPSLSPQDRGREASAQVFLGYGSSVIPP